MFQFSLDVIKNAVIALHKSNANEYFKIYLTLKRHGLSPHQEIAIDTGNTHEDLQILYEVHHLNEYDIGSIFYDPFTNKTLKDHAARSIIQTHMRKIVPGLSSIGEVNWLEITQRPSDRKWMVKTSAGYPMGLGAGLSGFASRDKQIRIPTSDFLIWFYRYETFPEHPSFNSLFQSMQDEMNFTEAEIYLLFDNEREWKINPFTETTLNRKQLAEFIYQHSQSGASEINTIDFPAYTTKQFRRIVGAFQMSQSKNEWWIAQDIEAEAQEILSKQRVLLLVGPPGVGKTRLAKQLAHMLVGNRDIHEFQFHSSYSYEDFMEALVPQIDAAGNMIFIAQTKRFLKALEAAQTSTQVVIIDEMNRADVSKVLGEALQLLELDYRGREHAIPRLYNQAETIWVPENFYLIATMNDIDRNTYEVDIALRRRFGQVYLKPNSSILSEMLSSQCNDVEFVRIVSSLLDQVQEYYPLGHAYFKDLEARVDLPKIYRRTIRPILAEFFGEYRKDDLLAVDMLFKQAYEATTFEQFIGMAE